LANLSVGAHREERGHRDTIAAHSRISGCAAANRGFGAAFAHPTVCDGVGLRLILLSLKTKSRCDLGGRRLAQQIDLSPQAANVQPNAYCSENRSGDSSWPSRCQSRPLVGPVVRPGSYGDLKVSAALCRWFTRGAAWAGAAIMMASAANVAILLFVDMSPLSFSCQAVNFLAPVSVRMQHAYACPIPAYVNPFTFGIEFLRATPRQPAHRKERRAKKGALLSRYDERRRNPPIGQCRRVG
jgi:hypothetical protein